MFNFFEQPWTLLVIAGGVLVVLLIMHGFRPGRFPWWHWLAPLFIAAVAFGSDYLVETEREEIIAVINIVLNAAENEDPDAIEPLIAGDYHDSFHNTRKALMHYCRMWLTEPLIKKNHKTILETDISPPQAVVIMTVRMIFDERSFVAQNFRSMMTAKVEINLEKQQGDWLIERVEILELMGRATKWSEINSSVW